MIFLQTVFLAVACVSSNAFPQAVFPAGIDPRACPSYPNCGVNSAILSANPVAPAGVDLARCPAFPFCDNNAAAAPQAPELRFPAGVDPTKCPGFPFQPCV